MSLMPFLFVCCLMMTTLAAMTSFAQETLVDELPAITELPLDNAEEEEDDQPLNDGMTSQMENDFTEDGEKLWGGDMILTPEQAEAWFGEGRGGQSVVDNRKAITDLNGRWPNAKVPYRIDTTAVGDREIILKGLQHWTEHTCLTFNEVGGTPNYPHLIFTKGTNGCRSYVGKLSRNGQDISACTTLNTVVHEVGHAIGFVHEQSRRDRDRYVRIHYENIRPGSESIFNIQQNTNDYGVPYDYTSVMHYARKAFSKDGNVTISAVDPKNDPLIDRRRAGLSFADKKLANIIYNCSLRCVGSKRPACRNSGFVDKNCRCVCPPEFDGNLCQTRLRQATGGGRK